MRYTEEILQLWTAPLSQKEEERAENAIKMIRAAVDGNAELKTMDIEVFTQGSFANNTNVRKESDVDVSSSSVPLKQYTVRPDLEIPVVVSALLNPSSEDGIIRNVHRSCEKTICPLASVCI